MLTLTLVRLCERDIRGAQGAGEILSLLLFNEVWYEQGPPIVPGEDTTNCVEAYRDSTAWMATYMAGGGGVLKVSWCHLLMVGLGVEGGLSEQNHSCF